MDIKEEDHLSNDIASLDETELFTKIDTMKISSDAVLLDQHCDMAIKTEIKSETTFPEFCSQKETECFTKRLVKQTKIETKTSSDNCDIHTKKETETQTLVSDLDSLTKREFLPENPVMKVKECNSDQELDNKIEIKEGPWGLEIETSSVYDNIKDGDLTAIKSSRSWKEAVSGDNNGKSLFESNEVSEIGTNFYIRHHHPERAGLEGDIRDIPVVEEYVHSQQAGKNSNGEICSRALYSKSKKPHQCKTCDKSFTQMSDLKQHNLIHEGKRPHQCKACDKSFTHLSNLKTHNLIHEGKRPHQCKACDKKFTQLRHLKNHILIHEGKKAHQCTIYDKIFTRLSNLKTQFYS